MFRFWSNVRGSAIIGRAAQAQINLFEVFMGLGFGVLYFRVSILGVWGFIFLVFNIGGLGFEFNVKG